MAHRPRSPSGTFPVPRYCAKTRKSLSFLRSHTYQMEHGQDTHASYSAKGWKGSRPACESKDSPFCFHIRPRTLRHLSECTTLASSKSSVGVYGSLTYGEHSYSRTSYASRSRLGRKMFCSNTVRTGVRSDLSPSRQDPIRNAFLSLFALKRRNVWPSKGVGSNVEALHWVAKFSRTSTEVGSRRVCMVRLHHWMRWRAAHRNKFCRILQARLRTRSS